MGFVGGLFGGSSGASYNAIGNPNAVNNLQAQYGVVNNAENQLADIAAGNPNSVLARENQQLAEKNAQQAAGLIASQKGLNPALAARLASQQLGQANQGAAQATNDAQLGAISSLGQLGINQQNATQAGINSQNSANSNIANTNAQNQAGMLGSAVGGLATGLHLFAKGGIVPHYADGGSVPLIQAAPAPMSEPQSFAGKFFNNGSQFSQNFNAMADKVKSAQQQRAAAQESPLLVNAPMGTTANTPESQLPSTTMTAAHGGIAHNMKMGGKVPGKAAVKGDSEKNDTVPAMLSPKEIVIPRSIVMGENPGENAKKFVEAELAKIKKYADGGTVSGDGAYAPPDLSADASSAPSVPNSPLMNQADTSGGQGEVPVGQGNTPAAQTAPSSINAQTPAANPNLLLNLDPSVAADLQKDVNQQLAGVRQEAAARGALGTQKAGIANQAISDMQGANQQYSSKFQDLDQERQKLVDDIANTKIDPNRLIANMSTGDKIKNTIALVLGGIGGGLSHQENPVQKFLNNEIDNDIRAQQTDLGKKENLLSVNMRQFGNIRDAAQMTKANMMDITALKMQQAADQATDPIEKARAMQQAGQLKMQADQLIAPLKLKQAAINRASQMNDPSSLVPVLVPGEHQKQAFTEIQQAQNASGNEKSLLDTFDRAAQETRPLNSKYGTNVMRSLANTIPGYQPESKKALNALADPLIHDNEGRINELEQKHVQALFPQFGDSDKTIEQKRQGLQEFIEHKRSAPTAKAFGIDLDNFASTKGIPQIKTMNGIPHRKVPGGWERMS